MENYENKDRDRYYGIRCGDIVMVKYGANRGFGATVIGLGQFNNNLIFTYCDIIGIYSLVAEWCYTVEKVEDRGQIHAPAY